MAAVVRRCQELPGHELFQYVDEAGERQTIDSADVNEYVRQITGSEFTAKDFRTWAGTVLALAALRIAGADSAPPTKKNVNLAVAAVAERLRNTPTVSRNCYIHPAVVEAYLGSALRGPREHTPSAAGPTLRPEERALLALLTRKRTRGATAPTNGRGNPRLAGTAAR